MKKNVRLSDVSWDDLKIGMKVISAQGIPGKIIKLLDATHDRFPSIWIDWENGKESWIFHHQADRVIVVI